MIIRLFILIFLFGLGIGAVAHAETIPPAYQLTQQQVEAAVAEALADKGAGERIRATLTAGKAPVYYEGMQAVEPRFTGLTFDKATNRFTANLLVASGAQVLTAQAVGGRYEEMVLLPVVKRAVRSGDTIASADIDLMEFPFARTRTDMITDAAQLVGFSPRAAISPKRPIRAQEIAMPTLIRKNSVVSIRYISGNMEISTTGQAMTDGGKGDVIALRNLTSKAVMRGVVEDANNVTITAPGTAKQLAGDMHAAN